MKTFVVLATVAGVVVHVAARAQVPDARGPEVDFSGTYVGSPTITEPEAYPFTASGERAHEAYDPLVSDPRQADDCAPESMPSVLWAGTVSNMQVLQGDTSIELRYEHGGAVRTIHMDGAPPRTDEPHTGLGYSVGHWDGAVLTVETTHLDGGVVFINRGYPVSREARITERYRRESGLSLEMELVLWDPLNYTQPITLGREWIWSPDEQVRPWNCVSLGPRDEEPDIDELRRLLKEL